MESAKSSLMDLADELLIRCISESAEEKFNRDEQELLEELLRRYERAREFEP